MTVKVINLNKLIRLCMLPANELTSELRSDLRNERDKMLGVKSGGGHFHHPWWTAAKDHVLGKTDLTVQTSILIGISKQRKRLYPLLTERFLSWLVKLRRTTNLEIGWNEANVHTHYTVPGLDLTVKVDNLLALTLNGERHRLIYPYFSEDPPLTEQWARIALWLMNNALPEFSLPEMEFLDILRSQSYSGASLALQGDEKLVFEKRYQVILGRWDELRPEYGF